MSARLLTCDRLSVAYGGRLAVEDVSFTVDAGDYVAVVGANGSGKTTLMRAILRLIAPSSGSVRYESVLRREALGYLPQTVPSRDDFPASVREVVLSGCLNRSGMKPFYSREQVLRAEANMKRLDVWALRRLAWRSLSGGQKRRVLLARALSAADRLLLLDEPAAGLDPQITESFYELIGSLHQDGLTILMISHDLDAVMKSAGKILHMARRPLFFGTADAYRNSPVGRLQFEIEGGRP